MPPVEIYAVSIANGNRDPSIDANGWGSMQEGNGVLGPNDAVARAGNSRGLSLSLTRASNAPRGLAANGLYALPPAGVLPLASRLLLRVEFDSPYATPPVEQLQAEPWALALVVKQARSADDALDRPFVAATCQFNRNTHNWDGARLNIVAEEQSDQASALDEGTNYRRFLRRIRPFPYLWPVPFVLQHSFCGVNRIAGFGALAIGSKSDSRAYSTTALAPAAPTPLAGDPTIGAVGISLATIRGVGTISVRLRRFSVSMWPVLDGAQRPGIEVEL
jgi:hypothetical protein